MPQPSLASAGGLPPSPLVSLSEVSADVSLVSLVSSALDVVAFVAVDVLVDVVVLELSRVVDVLAVEVDV